MQDEYFEHAPEVWDAATCKRRARAVGVDAYGTKDFRAGMIGDQYGTKTYNGGIVIDGKWYKGEVVPLPVVADGYEIVRVPYWGWRIVAAAGANEVTL